MQHDMHYGLTAVCYLPVRLLRAYVTGAQPYRPSGLKEAEMKRILVFISLILFAFSTAAAAAAAAAEVKPGAPAAQASPQAPMDKYRQAKASLEQAYQTKANVYAKDVLEEAGRTITKALEAIEGRNEAAARQALDKAALQIELAAAKTRERETAEKTAVTRAKADKLSQRLADILAGKGDGK
jgi:hypothetical protein